MIFFIAQLTGLFHFAATTCSHTFFFVPSWWEYVKNQPVPPNCSIDFVFPDDILPIGLAVLDILMRLAGFAAVISIIWAGISHLFTGGNPEKAAAARRRIFNSFIGLAIALVSVALVTFIGNRLGG